MTEKRNNNNSLQVKVIIVGDSGVGKTNLLTRYCEGIFKQSYVATIGVDFKMKTLQIANKKLKLQIWDTAGQQRFRNVTQTYFKGAKGVILVYAIDNFNSFKNIQNWIKLIENNTTQTISKILIGAKSDKQQQRVVEREQGQKLAAKYNMPFLQVSSKTGDKVNDTFTVLGGLIAEMNKDEFIDDKIQITGINLNAANSNTQRKHCSC